MADIKVNDLPITPIVEDSDTIMMVRDNTSTKQVTVDSVASYLLTEKQFPELPGLGKTVVSSIQELAGGGLELVGTLEAFKTTLKFSNSAIKRTSTIEAFYDSYHVVAKDIVATVGLVTLFFDPYPEDHQVKVKVS